MQKAKRNQCPISARIEKGIFERLEKFCEDSELGKTVMLERVLNIISNTLNRWYTERVREYEM